MDFILTASAREEGRSALPTSCPPPPHLQEPLLVRIDLFSSPLKPLPWELSQLKDREKGSSERATDLLKVTQQISGRAEA